MIKFDLDFFYQLIPTMIHYLPVTISISFYALIIGFILAVIIATAVEMELKGFSQLAKVYVSFFRGTPLVAQLFLLYFGSVQIFPILINMSAYTASVIGLALNASAYMSETIRGAISAVDKGQMEAALSIGMTPLQAMSKIILPQAARVAIPALSNNFIDIVKGSALAFTIGVTEIMATAQMEGASAYRFLEAFTAVVLIYWVLISSLSFGQKRLELYMNRFC